jgi:hypothetical protein
MGGCSNPELVRSTLDGCHWLSGIAGYPVKEAMRLVAKVVGECVVGGGGSTVPLSVHYDRVVYLPSNTGDYTVPLLQVQADAQFRHTALRGQAMTRKKICHISAGWPKQKQVGGSGQGAQPIQKRYQASHVFGAQNRFCGRGGDRRRLACR